MKSKFKFSNLSSFNVLFISMLMLCLHLGTASLLVAQSGNTPANRFVPLITSTYTNLTVSSSQVSIIGGDEFASKDNLKNADLTDAATWTYIVGGSAWIEVKDNLATGSVVHKGGSYVGFVVDENAVDVLGSTTVRTFLGNVEQEAKSSADLISVKGFLSGKSRIGFVTTAGKNFDRVRIEYSTLSVAGTRRVYYAEIVRYEGDVTVPCNEPTALRLSDGSSAGYPVQINQAQTKIEGLCVGCSVTAAANLIDGDATTSAKIDLPISAGEGRGSISVKSVGQAYQAGTFAGFDLSAPSIIGVGLSSGMKIETFLGGVSTGDVFVNGSFVSVGAPSSLLSGSGRQIVGFLSTEEFDEIKLTISKTGVSLGITEVFGAIVTNFCDDADLACNTLTTVKNPTHTVFIDGRHTGITSAACTACTINNSQNIIDNVNNAPASIVLTGGVAASASFAVSNAKSTYAENSFAGFDIESNTLLSASVISSARVHLLLNGVVVQEMFAGNQLIVGATSSALTGRSRQIVGVVANPGISYNGVKITFDQLVGANLGEIDIHGAIFDKSCAGTIACAQTLNLNMPDFPVVINASGTGFEGVACAACYIKDPWNAVSSSTTDFAQIGNILNGAATGSLAVLDPVSSYPAGTFAGFTIKKNAFLVSADLFQKLTVQTYNNGVLQEEASGASLLNLTVLTQIFGSASDFYNPGFVTTKPFDEVRISVSSLLSLGLDNSVDVYGAFVDTRTSSGGSLLCFQTNPDNNVTYLGVTVTGNVSTNDEIPSGSTYGTPAGTGNPSADLPAMNTDGSYSFTPSVAGIYSFTVPVCLAGQTTGCATEKLTIHVLNADIANNPPVANDDIATIKGHPTTPVAVIVDVAGNDGAGNLGGTLGAPSISVGPANGTATIVDGKVEYTPNAGYYGMDIVTYQICESPSHPGSCTTAELTITVLEPGAPNTLSASDDYVSTGMDAVLAASASDGVLANDYDLDGDSLVVTQQNTTIPGVGSLDLESDGSYMFTPVTGYTGPASFVYTVCDGVSGCKEATLYIMVIEVPDLSPSISFRPAVIQGPTQVGVILNVYEFNDLATSGQIKVYILKDPKYVLDFDPTATMITGRSVQNAKWAFSSSDPLYYIFTTNEVIGASQGLAAGLTTLFTPGATKGKTTISAIIESFSGGETNAANNTDSDVLIYKP